MSDINIKLIFLVMFLSGCTKIVVKEVPIDNFCPISMTESVTSYGLISEPFIGLEEDTNITKEYLEKRVLTMCKLGCFDGELGEKCKALLEAN